MIILFVLSGIFVIYKTRFLFIDGKKKRNVTEKLNSNQIESNKKNQYTNKSADKGNDSTKSNLIYNSQSIPVLYYHSIAYEEGNELRIPKEKFRQQMQYLKDNGYTTLSLDEFYNFLTENTPIPNKSVIITFDDGYRNNYKNAFPILKELGFTFSGKKLAWYWKPGTFRKKSKKRSSKRYFTIND